MRGPSGVMATVCSTWTPRDPSPLRSVQPSWSTRSSSWPPARNQGSIAMTRPGCSRTPRPARPSLGTEGDSCMLCPTPCPPKSVLIPYPPGPPPLPARRGDVTDLVSGLGRRDARGQGGLGHRDQLLVGPARLADDDRD